MSQSILSDTYKSFRGATGPTHDDKNSLAPYVNSHSKLLLLPEGKCALTVLCGKIGLEYLAVSPVIFRRIYIITCGTKLLHYRTYLGYYPFCTFSHDTVYRT
jgi:hypothetical protein